MNTWEFDGEQIRFHSDDELQLEKVQLWMASQEVAIRNNYMNELIWKKTQRAIESGEMKYASDDEVDFSPLTTIDLQEVKNGRTNNAQPELPEVTC